MAVTGRAALAALVGAALVLVFPGGWWVLLAAWGVLAVLVGVDVLFAGAVGALRLTRSGDTSCRLDQTATVVLTVENHGARRVHGLLRDAWPPSAGTTPRRHRIAVPAGERRRVETVLHPTRRGDRGAARVTVRSYGPLRLAARQGSREVPWTVRVLPAFPSRRHLPGKLAKLREADGRQAARIRGQGTEFDSLREYVDGDDVRSIDWRATARRLGGDAEGGGNRSAVVVRTWRPERDRRILIVLDTGRTSAARVGDIPRLDAAMDAALLLTALASRVGDRVDFVAYDRQVRAQVRHASREKVLGAVVDVMAPLESQLVEIDPVGLTAVALEKARQRSLVVVLTDLSQSALEDGLVPRLPLLAAKHLVLVAAVADPGVAEMARRRGDAAAVYDAAAAERTSESRGHVTASLRRHGAEVVDAPPDELAPALADRYIALKAAGRL
ncbi:MAG: DUF58 domain-containing protein [Streptosporangiales bacterium]|nr:DUF58 domain-containing protein [Streptosporangiales bacterium]